jgi:hypothetical protein
MKPRQDKASATDTQFDEWAKAVAHGLTRRKTLQLIGGTFTGALLALRGPKAWAVPTPGTQGCGHVCAPLFNPGNQAAFNTCTQACEDCKTCHGRPGLTTTWPQVLVCHTRTPCRNGGGVICCSSGQTCCNGTCVGPCPQGQTINCSTQACVCDSGAGYTTCISDTGEVNCCSSGQDCCRGICMPACRAGQSRNLLTCQCVPLNPTPQGLLNCVCNGDPLTTLSAGCIPGCETSEACQSICAESGGVLSATCSNPPSCPPF